MEVDKVAFNARLLDVLIAIAEAHFVSFDLELSGVPVKGPGNSGKPSLQERYLETKEAAEKYQILQFGLTCVTEEDDSGVYLCKPFNFNISPVLDEKRLDIDRTFSFHSGAVEFLLSVGFRMDLPFTSGVPYLSRSEAALAEQLAGMRNDRSAIADIQIKPEDTQSVAFLRRVRAEITAWKKLDRARHPSLMIIPEIEHGRPASPELTRFERRLVHQLVRAEYPDLVTVPSRGMIRIVQFDHEREERIKAERLREARDRINKQTGFRWVIEALAGYPPSDLNPKQFAVDPKTGEAVLADLDDIRSRCSRAQHLIRNKKSVLVGHNLFLDLIYLYKAFIGPLPNHVNDFIGLIHEMFPMVIDTKYMATHNCGDINPRSSLEEIAEQLSSEQYPLLGTHKDHCKYRGTTAFHEAGYDSLLTAQVVVRLSAKLETAGTYIEDTSEPSSPDEPGGVGLGLNGGALAFTPRDRNPVGQVTSTLSSAIGGLRHLVLDPLKAMSGDGRTAQPQGSTLMSQNEAIEGSLSPTQRTQTNGKAKKSESRMKRTTRQSNKPQMGRFAHVTAFDGLQDMSGESGDDEVLQFDELPSSSAFDMSAPVVADTDGVSARTVAPADRDTPFWRREGGRAMPRFKSDFWAVYGNKLRVFGTQEGVCLLDG